jgi:hypothetical protein
MTLPAEPESTSKPAKPGLLDRLRARFGWFDHVMRAQQRYQDSKGDFFAAGVTYFTIFALFPLLMVGFAAGGFVLSRNPELLAHIEVQIKSNVSGEFGQQLVNLMDSAIASRTSVGIIGLATAAWAGLGWTANLREALSQMWGQTRTDPPGFVRAKLSDLAAMVGMFIAIAVTIALTVLGNADLMKRVLEWLGLQDRLAAVHMDHCAAAPRVGQLRKLCACRVDRRGCVRDLQAGRVDLPENGVARSGRRHLRPGAGSDGVRVHHRAADPVRDGMGGHVHRESQRRTGRRARPCADHPKGADQ